MILEDATKEAFGYYALELKPQSNRTILAACDLCGKFKFTTKNAYHTFCASCADEYGSGKSERFCKFCGEKFYTWKSRIKKGECKYCCRKCYLEAHKKVECTCQWCGKEFLVWPCRIKKGGGKYCNNSCWSKAQRHNVRPRMTTPEIAFQEICIDNNLPFEFVGDGALWLGNVNPDFIHNTKRIVVEVFGDYYHGPIINRFVPLKQQLPYKRKQLKAEGYKCIFIWESDLKRKDAEAFVMNLMHEEVII